METETSIFLNNRKIDNQVTQILPEEIIKRLRMLPISIEGDQLYVAVSMPVDLPGIDEIKSLTGLRVKPVILSEDELTNVIKTQLKTNRQTKQTIADITFEGVSASEEMNVEVADTIIDTEEAPVVSLVNTIIQWGINEGASDIHLEPQFSLMRVRYRINGILQTVNTVPQHIAPSVVSRIKLLADMDITERRRPQDGHISITNFEGRAIDLRVSTILTVKGEKVVIRILDKKSMLPNLEQLGMLPEQQKLLESFITRPNGIILTTGPTGSGKTTTLYVALSMLDANKSNIVTVENPVEYQLDDINQVQVNSYINFGFTNALRTIVRQDPDIIMIGEIRDFETAEIAIQSALTGHLVLSTLHTNDAPSAVIRLMDMEVQPFLIASAVRGIVAQRLVRAICQECKELYTPSADELNLMNLPADSDVKFTRGRGCKTCYDTGYGKRAGVYEVLEIDEDIRKLILSRASASDIKQVAISKGMKTLSQVGREKIIQGFTTVKEIQRVISLEDK